MNQTILVVAAHPDDEILGCGGTIANHAKAGDTVHVVIMAEGITSRSQQRNAASQRSELDQLASVAHEANRLLGATSVVLHSLPDNRMDSLDQLDVIKLIEGEIDRVKPSVVYTHHAGDLNIDHRIVQDSVATACRPMPGCCVQTLLFFEIPSSTEWRPTAVGIPFSPNWFVDITATLELKQKALSCYRDEMRQWPHPRSIEGVEHLARWRGVSNGVEAAEAFMLGRHRVVTTPARRP
jgi:LmbE family N-acetylglucosaminyl deacetylase